MSTANETDGLEGIRVPEDVMAFMALYERAEKLRASERRTFAGLFGGGTYSTAAGQLGRVAAFAARQIRSEATAAVRRTGLEILFERRADGDGGLQATAVADALYKEFRLLHEVCENVGPRVRQEVGRAEFPRKVRVGASQNMGYFILPFCLSNWSECFGNRLRLSLEVHNTPQLLTRLEAGLLDFVVAYGAEKGKGIVQDSLRVAFSSFEPEFKSEFLLTCHPYAKVWYDGNDVNMDYWRKVWDEGRKKPNIDDLQALSLEKIDFRGTSIIVSPTWKPPEGIVKLEKKATEAGATVRRVSGYEEAAAMVRCNLAMSVLPQAFSSRRMLTAFRLKPGNQFLRWIGAFYSTRFALSEEAYRVLAFISGYMAEYRESLRKGKPPCIEEPAGEGEKPYREWSAAFRVGDWREAVMRDYPLPRKGKNTRSARDKVE